MSIQPTSVSTRLLLAWSVSVACWALLLSVPQIMQGEHGIQRLVAKIFYPYYQQGNEPGTHQAPFTLFKVAAASSVDAPFVIAMGEDPDRIFDANPLSASDAAVLLDAIKKSGVQAVVIGSPFAWAEADPFALDALEYAMSRFTACVTSAALGRAAEPDAMPPAMVRASIPLSSIQGSAATLPVVNRVTVAGTYLGREHTWAGFSEIESETPSPDRTCLLARWGDRVVFSSTLLAVLVRENIHLDELVIEPSKTIQSPRTGHAWAIDEFGRGHLKESPLREPDLQAHQLIRPEPAELTLLREHTPPVHLMKAEAVPSQGQVLSSLYQTPRFGEQRTWHRLPMLMEWGCVTVISLFAALAVIFPHKVRWPIVLSLALWWLMTLLGAQYWIPLTPSLIACIVAYRRHAHRRFGSSALTKLLGSDSSHSSDDAGAKPEIRS